MPGTHPDRSECREHGPVGSGPRSSEVTDHDEQHGKRQIIVVERAESAGSVDVDFAAFLCYHGALTRDDDEEYVPGHAGTEDAPTCR